MNLEFGRRIKICIQLSEAKCFRHKVHLKTLLRFLFVALSQQFM